MKTKNIALAAALSTLTGCGPTELALMVVPLALIFGVVYLAVRLAMPRKEK